MPTAPQPLRARKSGWPAAPPRPAPVVDYPDRGVEPMTSDHLDALLDAIPSLRSHYAHRDDVYVGGELTMYWLEGNDERWYRPDVFVAFGSSRDRRRRVWLSWEEGKFADFILEVASKGTRRRDQTEKVTSYEGLCVEEYWQHDPTGKHLPARLLGHRLNKAGAYEPVPLQTRPDGTRYGKSKTLGLHLCLDDDGCLRLYDPATGEFLLRNLEKDDALAEERRGREEERRAREAAEAELAELKRQLANR